MTIFDEKIIAQWEHLTHAMTFDEGIWFHSTSFISMIISVETLCGFAP